MKRVMLLLSAFALVAIPACKKHDGSCGSCHKEKRSHGCRKCAFFGRCEKGQEHAEHHRFDEEADGHAEHGHHHEDEK